FFCFPERGGGLWAKNFKNVGGGDWGSRYCRNTWPRNLRVRLGSAACARLCATSGVSGSPEMCNPESLRTSHVTFGAAVLIILKRDATRRALRRITRHRSCSGTSAVRLAADSIGA